MPYVGARGNAPALDLDRGRLTGLQVELPDAEIALEYDGAPICRNRGPDYPAAGEFGDLPGRSTGQRTLPDVLCAAAVGHVVKALAVVRPHRPGLLGAAVRHALVYRRRALPPQPDLGFVQVAVPLPPPLAAGHAARRKRQRPAVGCGRREVLRGVPIGAHLHGSAALARDAVDVVHPRDIARRGREVHPAAVGRPAFHQLARIIERQALQLAAGKGQEVDIAVAGAHRAEGQVFAVGRVMRRKLGGRVRD